MRRRRSGDGSPVRLETADQPDLVGFVEEEYLEANPDVAAAVSRGDFESGAAHYAMFGSSEGRPLAAAESRVNILRRGLDMTSPGLEIGPCHSPIVAKADGYAVEIVDYLDTDTLRAHYEPQRGAGVDVDRIEEVDHVWRGEPLSELVGRRGSHAWVIASHVLEHIPDPIGFLVGVADVLAPGGSLSMALPDKRYTFDHLAPLTTTGQWIDAHLGARTAPSAGQAFDYFAHSVRSDGRIAWGEGFDGELDFIHSLAMAADSLDAVAAGEDFGGEVHLWRFTPESFALLIAELGTIGLIDLEICGSHPTRGSEFFVTLAHGRTVVDEPTRLAMVRAAVDSDRSSAV